MSFTVTTDVFCDNCNDWTHGTAGKKIDRVRATEVALSRGWTFEKKKHLCPICNGKAEFKLLDGSYKFKAKDKL
jgi:hypothetical protein